MRRESAVAQSMFDRYVSEANDTSEKMRILRKLSDITGVKINDFDRSLERLAGEASDAVGDVLGNNWPENLPTPMELEDDGRDDDAEAVASLVREYVRQEI